ncbi:MAG: heterocyst differentiation related protein [Calothrix sp. MO_167.B42]|nr:heterocyst differentiation related protein [Calothrix sp. MO_167.B42]
MSESMAFVGGVAIAGLAALLLLKGAAGNTPVQPNFTVSPPVQAPVVTPMMPQVGTYPYLQQNPNVPLPVNPNTSQTIAELEKLKVISERLQQENNQLKVQNQQMQFQLQQLQLNAQNTNQQAATPAELNSTENTLLSSPIIWAVGGMSLAIGGGVVVAGVLALFSPKERSTRTVQVLHPYHNPNQPLVPLRRAEFLPPRKEVRRVQQTHEYDDMH